MMASTGFEPMCDRMVLGAYKWSVFSDRNEQRFASAAVTAHREYF